MSNESRRKILKSIVAGSGAVIAGKSLPENWTKPVVDSVTLPAHAQTSVAPPQACTPDPIEVTTNDGIGINFDGNSCSTYIGSGTSDIQSADTMLYIDNDQTEFDLHGPNYGANWGVGPDINNQPPGTYSYTMTRVANPNNGISYEITFTVAFSGGAMIVSNISFIQV